MGLAVPVAFIAGAPIMNYHDLSRAATATAPAQQTVSVGNTVSKPDNQAELAAERAKWEAESQKARAEVANLRQQLEQVRTEAEAAKVEQLARQQDAEKRAADIVLQQSAAMVTEPEAPTQVVSAKMERFEQQDVATPPTDEEANDTSPVAQELQRLVENSANRSISPGTGETAVNPDEVTAAVETPAVAETPAAAETAAPVQSASLTPRTGDAVDKALARATEIESLSADARGELRSKLVAGECVSTSLQAVFGSPVPVFPLRNLLRDLGSQC